MTEKIYYQDAAISSVKADVIANGVDEKGAYAILNRSCFYPEGGGQPSDTGFIGETKVIDVQIIEDEIRHYTDRMLDKGQYTIVLDWQRRFDHMQQHTGQHLLSAVFEDSFGMATKSFHLGTERVSIDLDEKTIGEGQLKEVEEQVNSLIYRQIPVETEWVTQEQASRMPLRKEPAVKGDIRLVKIADIDVNACGGTHLQNTGELGLIKIIRTEKSKSGTRLYFLCGQRALNHFGLLQTVADQLTKSLNAPAAELPEAAIAVLNDRKEKEKQLKKLEFQLLEMEAEGIKPDGNILVRNFIDRDFKEVQQLAKLMAEKHPSLYLLFIVQAGSNVRFVCAKGKNAPGDMKEVLSEIIGDTGRAGGNKEIAQGVGAMNKEPADYAEIFQNILGKIT